MVDTKNTKDGKVGTKNTKNEQGRSKRSSGRVRECLKEEPLQPVYTGRRKKTRHSTRPTFNTKKNRKISTTKPTKIKSQSQASTNHSSGRGGKPRARKQKTKRASNLPRIVVESDFESEVVFHPARRCEACEGGRKGEGGTDCWACRLARLQNIQRDKLRSLI